MEGMAAIEFPVTTNSPEAQQFINQGIGQLHGFWYLEAERSFRQAAAIDEDCAMSYWGMAMANANNDKRAKEFIGDAEDLKDRVTPRERMYIEALAKYVRADKKKRKERAQSYTKALEQLLYKYPDDVDAKAFLALQLWKNRSAGVPISSHLAIDALLGQVFAAQPMHPAHHYRIHLWDYQKPEKALASSALGGQTAPGIAHLWHMPGHIYSRLKRYEDAVWQQEASARVDHAHMMRDQILPDQIHNFAHNNEWLIRNLNYIGRVNDAIDLAKNMIELPRHPKYNTLGRRGSTNYGRMRLFETLSRYEMWDQMIALCDTPYLEPTDNAKEQVKRLRHLGRAHFRKGDAAAGKIVLADIQSKVDSLRAARDKAGKDAEKKLRDQLIKKEIDTAAVEKVVTAAREALASEELDDDQRKAKLGEAREKAIAEQLKKHKKRMDKAVADARKSHDAKLRDVERALWELQGLEKLAAGEAKPALGLLKKAGGVNAMFLALVQFQAGDADGALKAAESHVKSHRNEVQPLACRADLLMRAGKQDEAQKVFEQLRKQSASLDLVSPVFQRLEPLAASLELPTDWRVESVASSDIGQRPPLDSLGPFRWRPSPATGWTLKGPDGKTRSFKQFQGRPVVAIFYLGFGCLHCVEQLHAFAPKHEEFEKLGISLVGIGSDTLDGLQKSLEDLGDKKMPIPLVADPELKTFKDYRVYDDFEQLPLHGTFLIDADGLVRWQDISYEPFMDVDFLLREAKRLLDSDPVQAAGGTAKAAENVSENAAGP